MLMEGRFSMAEEKKDRGPVRLQTPPKPTSKQRRELPGGKHEEQTPRSLTRAASAKTVKQATKAKRQTGQLKKVTTAAKKAKPKAKKKTFRKR